MVEEKVADIEVRNAAIDQRTAALESTEEESRQLVADLSSELENVTKVKAETDIKIGEAKGKWTSLENGLSNLAKQKSELVSVVEDREAHIESLKSERTNLRLETDLQKKELEKIKQEIRLFPSEIAGFVKEGKQTTWTYIAMSTPFVLIIVYVTVSLFFNAENLLPLYKKEEFDIWSVFLTRLPFVVVAVVILEVCGSIVRRFINEIVQINKQRLNLSKLSIIVRDVTTASSNELDISDEEKFELETYLKMELLREHIKDYVGEDYNPKQGKVASLLAKILEPKLGKALRILNSTDEKFMPKADKEG